VTYTDKPDECDACNWPTEHLEERDAYARNPDHGPFTPEEDKQRAWLCEVCRSTRSGNAYMYPTSHDTGTASVLNMVAWCTNRILAAIQETP